MYTVTDTRTRSGRGAKPSESSRRRQGAATSTSFWDHFPLVSQGYTTPHLPCDILFFPMNLVHVHIGRFFGCLADALNPMKRSIIIIIIHVDLGFVLQLPDGVHRDGGVPGRVGRGARALQHLPRLAARAARRLEGDRKDRRHHRAVRRRSHRVPAVVHWVRTAALAPIRRPRSHPRSTLVPPLFHPRAVRVLTSHCPQHLDVPIWSPFR